MKNFILFLMKILYPSRCSFCSCVVSEDAKYYLCEKCISKLRLITGNSCKRCGKSLELGYEETCTDCRVIKHHFDRAFSAAQYRDELKGALIRYKFFGKKQLAHTFVQLMEDKLSEMSGIDLVMAVPLHERKLKERGFNQCERLAKPLAEKLGCHYEWGALFRTKYTESQSTLSRIKRLKNLKNAFKVLDKDKVKGKNILIIDDIYTTGSTVSECAKALKDGGAKAVYVLTVASGKGF